GKCESGETSINDFSDIGPIVGRLIRSRQRAHAWGFPSMSLGARRLPFVNPETFGADIDALQQIQRAQIIAWLIEAATAKRHNESATILQAFGVDPPLAPRKKIVGERK